MKTTTQYWTHNTSLRRCNGFWKIKPGEPIQYYSEPMNYFSEAATSLSDIRSIGLRRTYREIEKRFPKAVNLRIKERNGKK